MKRLNSFTRRSAAALPAGLFSTILFGAQTARAQNVRPYVECVERADNGTSTTQFIAHFGYVNYGATSVFIPSTSASNSLSSVRNPPGQPQLFLPGVNPYAVSVTLNMGVSEQWRLTAFTTMASFSEENLCGKDGANARSMTYQGKLSDGAAAANGVYDLQFQLFSAATGGNPRTKPILMEDVAVANGIFTFQLNLGANSRISSYGETDNADLRLNPAVLDGSNLFFEIGVRLSNATGAFTVLTPRQPLTAVPLAMRASVAGVASRATVADEAKKV